MKLIPGVLTIAMTAVMFVSPAGAAYNATAAVSYANSWATANNPQYNAFSDDCTNFVSQALTAGGIPWVTDGDYASTSVWWDIPPDSSANIAEIYTLGGDANSESASVAHDLYLYLTGSGPGIQEGSFSYGSGAAAPSEPSSSIVPGDVFFYNWQGLGSPSSTPGAGGISHASIDVQTYGNALGYLGTLADWHTNDVKAGFWTAKPENIANGTAWQYTTIWYVHI